MYGDFRQFELFLNLLQYAGFLLLGVQLVGLFQSIDLVLLYIQDGKFQQMLLFASLWHDECNAAQFHFQLKRHDDFAGFALVSFSHFHDAELQKLLLGFIQPLLVFKGESLVNASVCDVQIIDVGRAFIHFDGEDIYIVNDAAYHFTLGTIILD